MPGTVLGVEAGAVKHTDEPHPSRPGRASWGAEQWINPPVHVGIGLVTKHHKLRGLRQMEPSVPEALEARNLPSRCQQSRALAEGFCRLPVILGAPWLVDAALQFPLIFAGHYPLCVWGGP